MELKELYDKITANDALKASFTEAANDKTSLEKWLREQGSSATVDDVAAFLRERSVKSGEIDDSELEAAAGGKGEWRAIGIGVGSVATLGLCFVEGIVASKAVKGEATKCFDVIE